MPTELDNALMMSQNKIAESVEAIRSCAERIAVTTENMDKYTSQQNSRENHAYLTCHQHIETQLSV